MVVMRSFRKARGAEKRRGGGASVRWNQRKLLALFLAIVALFGVNMFLRVAQDSKGEPTGAAAAGEGSAGGEESKKPPDLRTLDPFDCEPKDLDCIAARIPVHPSLNRPVVFLSLTNFGFIHFASNLICSYRRIPTVDMRSVVVAVTDDDSVDSLRQLRVTAAQVSFAFLPKQAMAYGGGTYRRATFAKTTAVYEFLQRGVLVLLVDVDIAMFKDPFRSGLKLFLDPYEADIDLQIQDNNMGELHRPKSAVGSVGVINTGFYLARPSNASLNYFRKLRDQGLRAAGGPSEQDTAVAILRQLLSGKLLQVLLPSGRWDPPLPNSDDPLKLRMRLLDKILAPNGGNYFDFNPACAAEYHRRFIKSDADWQPETRTDSGLRAQVSTILPVMVHGNYYFLEAKRQKLEEFGGWFLDAEGNCLGEPTRPFPKYEFPATSAAIAA